MIEGETGRGGGLGTRDEPAGTPGGTRLRALRRQAGRTQLHVEAEAGLGSGYLQRLEYGRVAQPARATLERILDALDARFGERREVLGLFGYGVAAAPPTDDEIAWARAVCRQELMAVPFPAYALDCTLRLVAWNGLVPRLFALPPDDPLFQQLAHGSLLEAWLDPASPVGRLVLDPDAFVPALVRALRDELQQFPLEPWCATLLARLWRSLPLFRRCWAQLEREPAPASAARPLVPLRLDVPGTGLLQFRLSSEHFTRDARFRIVYFHPADAETLRRCTEWAGG